MFLTLSGVSIKAILIHTKKTAEGEILKNYEQQLEIHCDEMGSDLFLLWPAIVVHKINSDSPLNKYSSIEMLRQKFEIVLILEGTVASTGQNVYAKTSYLPNEILWNYTYANMVKFNEKKQGYEVDYSRFDMVQEADYIPLKTPDKIIKTDKNSSDNYLPPLGNEKGLTNDSVTTIVASNKEGNVTPPFPHVWV